MPAGLFELYGLLPAFLLVLSRVVGIMIGAPMLGSVIIPFRVKALLGVGIVSATFPVIAPTLPQSLSIGNTLAGLPGELLIGLVIGMGLNIILLATQMCGVIVGQQAGLSLASVFNPNTESQSSVIGEVYLFTATAIFVMVGGHRAMIEALLDSFSALPVMTFSMNEDVMNVMVTLSTNSIEIAVKLAGPAVLALLVAKTSLGFLARTMPQLHILSVGFGVFVCVGMLISGLQMTVLYDVLSDALDAAMNALRLALGIA